MSSSVRWQRLLPAVLAVAGVGCSGSQNPPGPPPAPGVFIVAKEANVADTKVTVTVNVTGCSAVKGLEILQDGQFVRAATYTGPNTVIELPSGDFVGFLPKLGIAASLTLAAKAVCDDDREATSQPVGVRFFPVKSVFEVPGALPMPESFVAEGGGSNGAPVTFIGCATLETGVTIVRVDVQGNIVASSGALPFRCSAAAQLSELNAATNTRWLLEPGVGALAFVSKLGQTAPVADLTVTSFVAGKYMLLGVGPSGDAIVWEDQQFTNPALSRISVTGGRVWLNEIIGIPIASPVVDPSSGLLITASWNGHGETSTADIVTSTYDYASGMRTGMYALVTQSYGMLNIPLIPHAVFSPTGSTVYFAYSSDDRSRSGVMACASVGSPCQQRWQSPVFDGLLRDVVVFARGSALAAIGPNKTWFINATSGTLARQAPIVTTGSLITLGAQVGNGTDFYLLNGASNGFATEMVAVDSPAGGELWRYAMEGSGLTTATSLTIGIDDGAQSWLRVGTKQVRPLPLDEYRRARGPTP